MYYFKELIHVLYLMKQLHDLGKFEIVEGMYDWQLTDEDIFIDIYQAASYSAIQGIFSGCRFKADEEEYDCCDIVSLSDKVITDYYRLSGIYGKREKIKRKDNPYVKDAETEARRNFDFCYSLDWRIQGYINPKNSYQSRLEILIDYNGDVEIIGVSIGLAHMYKFFSDGCAELRKKLSDSNKKKHSLSGLAALRSAKRKEKKSRRQKRQKRAAFRSPRCAKRTGKRLAVQKVLPYVNAELPEQREAIAA